MFALLVLISLLASHVQSDKVMKEIQSMQDILKAIQFSNKIHPRLVATIFLKNKTLFHRLKQSQKMSYICRLIAMHDERFTQSWSRCFCDDSSFPHYCEILAARDLNINEIRRIQNEIGGVHPCKNEIQKDLEEIGNDMSFMDHRKVNANILVSNYTQYTKNKQDMSQDIQSIYHENSALIEQFCLLTPQLLSKMQTVFWVHRVLRKLKNIDIKHRILEDQIKMTFLSMVPFNFCYQDYLLSKCMCDESSSSFFCLGFFLKQAALVFANETMCDNYPGLTSTAPTSFSYSIILILLLSSLRF